jgi:hypothetical protein
MAPNPSARHGDPSKGRAGLSNLASWEKMREGSRSFESPPVPGLLNLTLHSWTTLAQRTQRIPIYLQILKSHLVIYILTPILPFYTCTSLEKIKTLKKRKETKQWLPGGSEHFYPLSPSPVTEAFLEVKGSASSCHWHIGDTRHMWGHGTPRMQQQDEARRKCQLLA